MSPRLIQTSDLAELELLHLDPDFFIESDLFVDEHESPFDEYDYDLVDLFKLTEK